jgi:aspartyl-tRNA synthetase
LRFTKTFTSVGELTDSRKDESVIVRARVHNVRGKGGLAFFVLREQCFTVQAVMANDDNISKHMVAWCSKVPKETIVEVKATVTVP